MNGETDFKPGVRIAAPLTQLGALPDAPLAMPKQNLTQPAGFGGGTFAAWLRLVFARTDRSGG